MHNLADKSHIRQVSSFPSIQVFSYTFEFRSISEGSSCKCTLFPVRTNKWACLVIPHSSQVQAHISWSHFSPHTVLLVSLPPPTFQKTPMCSFQFYFSAPFPPLVLNLSINSFYLVNTGRIWGVTNSLNFKFQVSNRSVKILKSSRLSHHKPRGCCSVSPQKLFALLMHRRGLTCHDLSFEMQIFIDGTEVFQLLFLLLTILTPLFKRLWNTKITHPVLQ